jgi:RNA polymerase sigma factor (sigma-70 family)
MDVVTTSVEQEILAARGGDLDAYSRLVVRFQDMAYGYALAQLGDRGDAEDAAQDAFLEAFRSLDSLREPAAFPGWFRRILHKRCDRIARKERPRPMALADDALGASDEDAGAEEERRAVRRIVAALPDEERAVIALFHLGGESLARTAEFLGLTLSTVKNRLTSARERLARGLESRLEEDLRMSRPSRDGSFAERLMSVLRAAAAGDREAVVALLDDDPELLSAAGPHPHWGGKPQPLHVAAERGRITVVRELLQRGADPNAANADYDGWSPLHLAVNSGHAATAALLREHGARVDIFVAAALGDAGRVRDLITEEPALGRARGPNGAEPISFAATVEVAELLLDAGADLDLRDSWGQTPTRSLATQRSRHPVVEFLLRRGRRHELDLALACALGLVDEVRAAIAADPAAIARFKPGRDGAAKLAPDSAPLHIAAMHDRVHVGRILLEAGAAVDIRSGNGRTPLHDAAFSGSMGMIELLLAHGADPEARDAELRTTPLAWAEFNEQREAAERLRRR